MWRNGTFLLYSCKAAFWIKEMSPRLSDVEHSVVLQSMFAIGSTCCFSGNVPLLHTSRYVIAHDSVSTAVNLFKVSWRGAPELLPTSFQPWILTICLAMFWRNTICNEPWVAADDISAWWYCFYVSCLSGAILVISAKVCLVLSLSLRLLSCGSSIIVQYFVTYTVSYSTASLEECHTNPLNAVQQP